MKRGLTVRKAVQAGALTAAAWAAAILAPAAAVMTPAIAWAQKADMRQFDYRLQARALAPGVWVVEGDNDDFTQANGCNIINTGFIATGAGVVVINTGPSRLYGEQLRRLIARTTPEPVLEVIHLNLHPDYFMGNQAFADVPLLATSATREGMAREGRAYEDNLYKLCGDWMLGTAIRLPTATLEPGVRRVGGREFELRELRGHTDSDLVLIDRTSGVVFAGGLVFVDRIPTTPHAQVGDWLASLDRLPSGGFRAMVPSHGPVVTDNRGIDQTRAYLQWLDRSFTQWAAKGWEMTDVIAGPVPAEFRGWAAFRTEYLRNVTHLYPRYERAVLQGGKSQ